MVKYKTRHKGYTLVELTVVLIILGIMMLGIPNAAQAFRYRQKSDMISMHKVMIAAIDNWIADNADPTQKPADFNAVNSQGRRVYQYIGDVEVLDKVMLKFDTSKKLEEQVGRTVFEPFNVQIWDKIEINTKNVDFTKGILTTKTTETGKKRHVDDLKYSVLPLDSDGKKIYDFENLKKKHILVFGDDKQYDPVNLK